MQIFIAYLFKRGEELLTVGVFAFLTARRPNCLEVRPVVHVSCRLPHHPLDVGVDNKAHLRLRKDAELVRAGAVHDLDLLHSSLGLFADSIHLLVCSQREHIEQRAVDFLALQVWPDNDTEEW